MLSTIIKRNDLHKCVLVSVRSNINLMGKTIEKDALQVVDWHMAASIHPMNYSISLPTDAGVCRMISKAGNFVVNFVGKELGSSMALHAGSDGSISDLFLLLDLEKGESEKVDSPCISDAKARLECEVLNEIESGDHTVFVGRVLNARNQNL